ncbi:hypothetical protein YC2023_080045 [Brassica napus]
MKVYANSLIGVGIASSLYHSSREKLRKYLRWADYTMIASATVRGESKVLDGCISFGSTLPASLGSAVHTGMMEVVFAKRALKDPDLKTAHNVHARSGTMWCLKPKKFIPIQERI